MSPYSKNMQNTPVIICAGQLTQDWQENQMPLEPLKMIQKVFFEVTNTITNISQYIDSVFVTNIFGYQYADAPALLCELLGLENVQVREFSSIGGNTPQYHVNKVCKDLEAGKLKMALLVGAEASYSLAKMLKAGIKSDWTPQKSPQYISGESRLGSSDLENNYELYLPAHVYPVFETAFRYKLGHTPAEHRHWVGKVYAPFSEVASRNSHAWQKNSYTSEQIITPSPENRYVAYPYTKRLCANNQVDQAAVLILTTEAIADELQVPQSQRVYPIGGADLNDIWDFASRPDIASSQAIAEAGKVALAQAQLTLEEIDAFDLYACFPVAVQVAREALGILPTDTRPLTLTGGLAYFGGAWNNYSMHAIVQAVENIRQIPQNILLTALGWYITKHAVGIYSAKSRGGASWTNSEKEAHLKQLQQKINESALPAPIVEAVGKFEVVGYTLIYERDGTPKRGIALGRVGEGRAWAFIEGSKEELLRLETEEWVGKVLTVQYDSHRKRNVVNL